MKLKLRSTKQILNYLNKLIVEKLQIIVMKANGNADGREATETFRGSGDEDGSGGPGRSRMQSYLGSSQMTGYESKLQQRESQRGSQLTSNPDGSVLPDNEEDQETRKKEASKRKRQSKLPTIRRARAHKQATGPVVPRVMEFTFTPEKIMTLMSSQRLKALEAYWTQHVAGVTCPQFTQLMLNHLHTGDDDEKYELVYGCFKLFSEVDINGDGMMEWGEFMQYIIDAVSGNTIKGADGQETVREQIARIKAKKYNRFAMARYPLDTSHHNEAIQQALLCEASGQVVSFERFSKEVKFYDCNLTFLGRQAIPLKRPGFVTAVAYDEKNAITGVSSSDGCLHFYQKTKIRTEFLKSIDCSCVQTRIWYMKRQQLWLTAGRDCKLRHWNRQKGGEPLQTLSIHTQDITDCVEIHNPSCIATCSLDKTIVMFDVEHRERLRTIAENHEKGIRHLRYQSLNGAIMISIGNEIYANVWAPESLVSDVHIGRLNGHKKSIVDGHFLNRAPYFVTIDETNVLNFWDIQTFMCIQQIPSAFKFQSEGLLVLSNNAFWAFGKRFFQFDTFQGDGEEEEQVGFGAGNEGDYPLCAYLNPYLLNIFVVQKHDVRMYDISKGRLKSLHNNIFQEEGAKSEITKFKIDKRHRKAYVANSQGQIQVINCQNGVIINNVTQYLDDRKNMKRAGPDEKDASSLTSMGSSHYSSDGEDRGAADLDAGPKKGRKRKDENEDPDLDKRSSRTDDEEANGPGDEGKDKKLSNPEITDMTLVWEKSVIMMLCSNSREYMVYDEKDPEESKLLRRVYGAHQEEITILAFDYHLSLVATGCINGEVALYDFEMSKIEGLLVGHTGDITAMEFLSPYPLLATASMDCTVCIWGVRPADTPYLNVCIKRFENLSWYYEKDLPCVVSRILVWTEKEMQGIKKYRRQKANQLPATAYRNFEHNFVFGFKDMPQIFDDEFPSKPNQLVQFSEEYKLQAVLDTEAYRELLLDEKSSTFVTQAQSVGADYNETLHVKKERTYLYIGDEFGFLKVWDLTSFLEGVPAPLGKCRRHVDIKSAFNPRRQETVDTSAATSHQRKSFQQKPPSLPHRVDPAMTGILIREAKAHTDVVTSISKMEFQDCQGVLTCARDNKVRTWSPNLDLWGNLNQRTEREDRLWHLPTEQKKISREEELLNVEKLIDNLEMDLDDERRPLVVDDNRVVKKVEVRAKSRANWFKLEEERKDKERELQAKLDQQKRDQQYKIEQGHLITEKIARLIAEQDVQLQMLQMTVPKKLPEGLPRGLQTVLNSEHKQLTEGPRAQLDEKDGTQPKLRKPLRQPSVKGPAQQSAGLSAKMKMSTSKNLPSDDQDQQSTQKALSISNQRSGRSPRGQQDPTESISGAPASPQRRNASLAKIVENSQSKAGPNAFEDSKQDKNSILGLATIPKIRNKLESLKKKDRFSTSPSGAEIRGPQAGQGLQAYLDSARFKARAGIRNPPSLAASARPFSIADSEIQKVGDLGGNGLIHEPSRASIESQSVNPQSLLKQRRSRSSARNQPQLHLVSSSRVSTTIDQQEFPINLKKPTQASPFGRNQYVSIVEHDDEEATGRLRGQGQSRNLGHFETTGDRTRDSKAQLQPLAPLNLRRGSQAGKAGSYKHSPGYPSSKASPPLVLPSVIQPTRHQAAARSRQPSGGHLLGYASPAPHQVGDPNPSQGLAEADQSSPALSVKPSGVMGHTYPGGASGDLSVVSAEDIRKQNEFELLKVKYCGASAQLRQEHRQLREGMEHVRNWYKASKQAEKLAGRAKARKPKPKTEDE